MTSTSTFGTLLILLTLLHPFSIISSTISLTNRHDILRLRRLAASKNVTCILVFGDSSVDPGNNNRLKTELKANFPPYGVNFFGRRPTGRFSDGRLATDFIAGALGFTKSLPAFLDTKKKKGELLRGVSFASAGSGYDNYTADLSKVLGVWKQIELLKHYKIQVSKIVGKEKAEEIVKGAVFLVSAGTNDFIQNYYLEPLRSTQYTLEQYENYLISYMLRYITEMKRLGAKRVVFVGISPLGCMPLMKTLKGSEQKQCVGTYNSAALSFNAKAKLKLASLAQTLRIKIPFLDTYSIIQNAINMPHTYGFVETRKGCCGSGLVEIANGCKNSATCSNPSKYVYWDAVHPTQRMYEIIAEEALTLFDQGLVI